MKGIRLNKENIVNIIEILIFITILVIIILLLSYYFNNKEYKVTFITDNNVIYASQSIKKGDNVIKPDIPKKENYEFIGWSYKGNLYNFEKPIEDNIKLFAEWKYVGK